MSRRLIIGTRHLCGESLAAWLALRHGAVEVSVEVVPLCRPDTARRLGAVSPTGTVPVLVTRSGVVAGALAIVEHAASETPALWPRPPLAALAREVALEGYTGFPELLALLPMDMHQRFTPPGPLLRPVARELDALRRLWASTRTAAGAGPFLFGAFSAVDALMAPLVARLVTHAVPLDGADAAYVEAFRALPEWREWLAGGEVAEEPVSLAMLLGRTAFAPLSEEEQARRRSLDRAFAAAGLPTTESVRRRPKPVRTQETIMLPDPDGRRRRRIRPPTR